MFLWIRFFGPPFILIITQMWFHFVYFTSTFHLWAKLIFYQIFHLNKIYFHNDKVISFVCKAHILLIHSQHLNGFSNQTCLCFTLTSIQSKCNKVADQLYIVINSLFWFPQTIRFLLSKVRLLFGKAKLNVTN